MTQHPTKEQVDAAKHRAECGYYMSPDQGFGAMSNDNKILASAERDAERRLGIMHDALRWGLDAPEGSPFRCGYDSSTAASTGVLMQEEVRAAMAAQRKEGE